LTEIWVHHFSVLDLIPNHGDTIQSRLSTMPLSPPAHSRGNDGYGIYFPSLEGMPLTNTVAEYPTHNGL
jgi:hypothetical protein